MRLGLQTIRESDPPETPEADGGSANPSEATPPSQTTGPSEPESEQRPVDKSNVESEKQPPDSPPESDDETEQTSETEQPEESSEEPSRSPSKSEAELDPEESGDEPVAPASDQETEEPSREGEESETQEKSTSDLLRKGTSFSSESRAGQGQNVEEGSSSGETPSVGESFQRYRTVETVQNSDTQSMRIVLSDTGIGSGGETTAVEVPSITVDREAPDRENVEEESPASSPMSPRQSSVAREALQQPLPEVPEWLERTGQDVRVILQFDIDRKGNVTDIEVLGSSGYPELDDRSIDRLGEWNYEPGTPVRDALTVFEFRLE